MEFDKNKYLKMSPMKYVGGAAASKHVASFLDNCSKYSDWFYSEKVDGEWCRIVYDMEGNVTIQGRGISKATGLHTDNTEKIPHLVDDIKKNYPLGTVIIGELSFSESRGRRQVDTSSILRSKPPRAIKLQKDDPLHFYIFDCLSFAGVDFASKKYDIRKDVVGSLSSEFTHPIKIKQVDSGAVEYLDTVLSEGGEGIMIMHKDGLYIPGGRSVKVSLKIKKEMGEMTLDVVDTVDPQIFYRGDNPDGWKYIDEYGKPVTKYYYYGWKNGIVVDYKGTKVKITSGISDSDAEWLSTDEAQEMIKNGRLKADVSAMSESDTINGGAPSLRHPVILKLRTDL